MSDTLVGVAGMAGGTGGLLLAVAGLVAGRRDDRDTTLLTVTGWLATPAIVVTLVCAAVGLWRWAV